MKKKIQTPLKFTLNKKTIARLNADMAMKLDGDRNAATFQSKICMSGGELSCNTSTGTLFN